MTKDSKAEDSKKHVLRVAVGSTNPCKVDAVKQALERALETSTELTVEVEVEGFSVESGVPDQPFGDKETQQGAKNRAESAFQAYKEEKKTYPHMAIGLEGGLEWSSIVPDVTGQDSLWCMAWIAIYGKRNALLVDWLASLETKFYNDDKKPIFGLAKTGTFRLPSALAALVEQGMELGDAHDKVFGTVNSKQGSGTVGLLTNGVIDRAAYYEHAFLLALVPWVRPDVYLKEGESGFAASFSCFSGKR